MLINKKIKVKINLTEYKTIIKSLNELRNKLIVQNSTTDCIDDLLLKLIK